MAHSSRFPEGIRIRSAARYRVFVRREKVERLKAEMVGGRFRFSAVEARIAGWHDAGVYYINEGYHRVSAALEIYWETGERAHLDALLRHGDWEGFAPPQSRRFPTLSLWSRLWDWFGI